MSSSEPPRVPHLQMYKDSSLSTVTTTRIECLDSRKKEILPNKFLHPNKRPTTLFSMTHWSPNIEKTKLHNSYGTSQCNNKLSTISPLCQHIQHQSTRKSPLFMRYCKLQSYPILLLSTQNDINRLQFPIIEISNNLIFHECMLLNFDTLTKS